MEKRLFFVQQDNIRGGYAELETQDVGHAVRVLRMQKNDELNICDGANHVYDGVIADISKARVLVRLGEMLEMSSEPLIHITLYQAMIKGAKIETVLQKCVELGVSRFVAFESERSVAKSKDSGKYDRYNSIIRHAAMQSGRGILPELVPTMDAKAAAAHAEGLDAALLLNEREQGNSIKHALKKLGSVRSLGIIVGPEGGFSDDEAGLFERHGARSVGLGPLILRTETAGMAAAAMVLYEMGLE